MLASYVTKVLAVPRLVHVPVIRIVGATIVELCDAGVIRTALAIVIEVA